MNVSGLWFSRPIFHFYYYFCLTHFTFVNFSYPYDPNLFSYPPFILSYAFILTDHTMKKE